MTHILLPTETPRRLVFYLAMEEYVAQHIKASDCFFMWQVSPTVIYGRNQTLEAEVNVDFCKAEGIALYRRKSGGGCVYSDEGNLMLSYICEGQPVGFVFDRYLHRIAHVLQQAGIDVQVSGRNDLVIDQRKVSGNAFYQLPHRNIVHGTLLHHTDFERMQKAITPSTQKLQSKGVPSVRSRVTNLCEHTEMSLDALKQHLVNELCTHSLTLTDEDVKAIEAIEQTYLQEDFIKGRRPHYSLTRQARLPHVGSVCTDIELKGERIRSICLTGDFFDLQDLHTELNKLLHKCAYSKEEVTQATSHFRMEDYVRNLTTQDWINTLFD